MSDKDNKALPIRDEATEFLLYTAPDGHVNVEAILHNETVWLTQQHMADIFGVGVPTISKHLKNIFESRELDEKVVVSILENTTRHGAISGKTQTKAVRHYNLDAIISVGYRVNSVRATQFRIWATQRLREYIVKGFTMDDERLKNGRYFGKNYVKELLERVRSIRASERQIYQKITDIFAECSIDYDPNSETTRQFYAHVQDKFHYAISGKTAAEIIYLSADSTKPLMGMKTYRDAPQGRVLKSDTTIGKNYLSEAQIRGLERTVSAFFDYIEGIIERRHRFTMEGFADSVNRFLEFNEYEVLEGYGKVTREQAEAKAFAEYEKFNAKQQIESDFDKQVKAIKKQIANENKNYGGKNMSEFEELLSDKILSWVDSHSWIDEEEVAGAMATNAFRFESDVEGSELVEFSKVDNAEYRFTVNFEMSGSHRDASLKLYDTVRVEVKGSIYYDKDKADWIVNDAQGEYQISANLVEDWR